MAVRTCASVMVTRGQALRSRVTRALKAGLGRVRARVRARGRGRARAQARGRVRVVRVGGTPNPTLAGAG